MISTEQPGYPSVDKPWLKYYSQEAIDAVLPECTVFEYLWENNKNHLDDVALIYMGQKITYYELFHNIKIVAKAFAAIGIQQGDIVAMCTVSTPETIYAFYALSCLGAVSNLIDLRADIKELRRCIVETESKIVLSLDLILERVQEAIIDTKVEKVIVLSPVASLSLAKKIIYKTFQLPRHKKIKNLFGWKEFISISGKETIDKYSVSAHDAVLITHTSGTTGNPKGVVLSNYNINAVAFQYSQGMTHSRRQKYMAIIPPFIAFGICVAIHLPLCLGMACIPVIKFQPDKFFDYLKKYQPNHFTCTPSNLEMLIKDKRNINLSFLRVPSVGGDYIGYSLEKDINQYFVKHNCKAELVKGYGMTEVSSSACTTKNGHNKYGSVGFPLVKMTISIFVPKTDRELTYGEEGEICFTGPNVMKGYFNNKEETEKVIIQHKDGALWVHSGDIGYMDEDGFLFVIDRLKRMIHLSNGIDLLPSKIERKLVELPQVKACAVIAHEEIDKRIVAKACVVVNDRNMTAEKLFCYCNEIIPNKFCLAHIEVIDDMPLTSVGKIDYCALEQNSKVLS